MDIEEEWSLVELVETMRSLQKEVQIYREDNERMIELRRRCYKF
jgi:hypothetical protein